MKIRGWIFIIGGVEDTRHKQLFSSRPKKSEQTSVRALL
jgi:hypothetical protein